MPTLPGIRAEAGCRRTQGEEKLFHQHKVSLFGVATFIDFIPKAGLGTRDWHLEKQDELSALCPGFSYI